MKVKVKLGKDLKLLDIFYTYNDGGKKKWQVHRTTSEAYDGYGCAILIDSRGPDNLYFKENDVVILTSIYMGNAEEAENIKKIERKVLSEDKAFFDSLEKAGEDWHPILSKEGVGSLPNSPKHYYPFIDLPDKLTDEFVRYFEQEVKEETSKIYINIWQHSVTKEFFTKVFNNAQDALLSKENLEIPQELLGFHSKNLHFIETLCRKYKKSIN